MKLILLHFILRRNCFTDKKRTNQLGIYQTTTIRDIACRSSLNGRVRILDASFMETNLSIFSPTDIRLRQPNISNNIIVLKYMRKHRCTLYFLTVLIFGKLNFQYVGPALNLSSVVSHLCSSFFGQDASCVYKVRSDICAYNLTYSGSKSFQFQSLKTSVKNCDFNFIGQPIWAEFLFYQQIRFTFTDESNSHLSFFI